MCTYTGTAFHFQMFWVCHNSCNFTYCLKVHSLFLLLPKFRFHSKFSFNSNFKHIFEKSYWFKLLNYLQLDLKIQGMLNCDMSSTTWFLLKAAVYPQEAWEHKILWSHCCAVDQSISSTLKYFLLGSLLRWSWWAILHLWQQCYCITNKRSFESLTTFEITSHLQLVWEKYSVKSWNLGGFLLFFMCCLCFLFQVHISILLATVLL